MTRRLPDGPLLEARVRLDSVPHAGRELEVIATPEQCARIAARMGVTSVERLHAKIHALVLRGGIRVSGELQATITQPCVVSFEPVSQTVVEKIDRIFLPGAPTQADAAGQTEIAIDGEDEPDYFEGPEVDLSELLLELLALGIDPYPRKPGAALPSGRAGQDSAADSPFAVLNKAKFTRD